MEKFKIPKVIFEDSTERYNLDINTLPFVSEFKILSFKGLTNFTDLTPQFNINEISGNRIVIKSIKFIRYSNENFNFLNWYKGNLDSFNLLLANVGSILLPTEFCNEIFNTSSQIEFSINDRNIIFKNNTNEGYGLSKDYNNIFAYFPEKIQKINFKINSQMCIDVTTATMDIFPIKVIIECYLL